MKKTLSIYTLLCFLITSIMGPNPVLAQDFRLPAPGVMVNLSSSFNPAVLKGIKLDPKNPFRFHFFVDSGDTKLSQTELKNKSSKLIKYFLASLTIPEKDLWVNLSPHEKDRIVPQEFGQTEMGRDLLAEDYILKQITASLIYPESRLGKEFWQKVYAKAQAKYGSTNIPINTFNKVWIVPEKAVVYENGGVAFVLENHLKVMLEQDYLSFGKHEGIQSKQAQVQDTNQIGNQVIREIVIPALTKEVNEGKNFSQLRQVFYSLILATWYKKKIKDSILNRIYSNHNIIGGINVPARGKDKIYEEYLKAFKKGVYNYIKEESAPLGNEVIPRKYFSGGVDAGQISRNMAMVGPNKGSFNFKNLKNIFEIDGTVKLDRAMNTKTGDRVVNPILFLLDHEFRKMIQEIYEIRYLEAGLPNDLVKRILDKLVAYASDPDVARKKVYQEVMHFKTDPIWLSQNLISHEFDSDYQQLKPYLKELPVKASIVDVGSGESTLTERISQDHPSWEIVASDITDYKRTSKYPNLRFSHQKDPFRIDLPTASADCVILNMMLHHVNTKDTIPFLKEIRRVLKPTGYVLLREDTFSNTEQIKGDPKVINYKLTQELVMHTDDFIKKIMIFKDWFRNVLIDEYTDLDMPYTFQSMPAWEQIFQQIGFSVGQIDFYGLPYIRGVMTFKPSMGGTMRANKIVVPVKGPGGIDLNPAQMSLQVKKDGQDFKFDFNDSNINAAQLTGATFTILTMTPVTNLPRALGLTDNKISLTAHLLD